MSQFKCLRCEQLGATCWLNFQRQYESACMLHNLWRVFFLSSWLHMHVSTLICKRCPPPIRIETFLVFLHHHFHGTMVKSNHFQPEIYRGVLPFLASVTYAEMCVWLWVCRVQPTVHHFFPTWCESAVKCSHQFPWWIPLKSWPTQNVKVTTLCHWNLDSLSSLILPLSWI